ncbi:MAG: SDR family NAD(P)-dependent oxidoreductase [Phycisphaerales bacterium]|nr:SDR family NAD(P)-dependent oxidoreductase [Phycisphaerales bacterium]
MAKKVFVIGATGTIGSAVVSELTPDWTVVPGSRSQGERIDLGDLASVEAAMGRVAAEHGQVDAIVSCAGGGMVGRIEEFDLDDFLPRLGTKLLGQVGVVRHGSRIVRPGGAIVLTSGVLEVVPQARMSHLAVINAAIRGFVCAAGIEYDQLRISAVSPGLVEESPQNVLDLFAGMTRISSAELAKVYRSAMESGAGGVVHEAFGA